LLSHRSVRGTFTSKVKDVMYSIFDNLPSINTQATPSQIQDWKARSDVKNCYSKLFKKIKDDNPTTYMSKIVEDLRKREKKILSRIQIAYAISICETYLCPHNQTIQISESIVKPKIVKNLVSFNFQLCITIMLKFLN